MTAGCREFSAPPFERLNPERTARSSATRPRGRQSRSGVELGVGRRFAVDERQSSDIPAGASHGCATHLRGTRHLAAAVGSSIGEPTALSGARNIDTELVKLAAAEQNCTANRVGAPTFSKYSDQAEIDGTRRNAPHASRAGVGSSA